ncbi:MULTISPECIES: glycoside hydrolase family 125 protein [Lactiplantibacillus]|uniref:Metal-independent alpha-mannosidase n=1 Tax=Lactiplantibacillus pentosus TaxID=1589 RepID=A0ABX5D0H7_LACPE|nr:MULTISPECIES: glycoside hydrolase family 125 protein [Lactiplantibacillus]MCC3164128.1 glycoside hydrolase family 125 protein [Lactiplantibacillus pentosus]MCJ8189115.1 glycoside hydrolase family 125 protein [Lactiplantibacillus pentosus]MCM8607695.1 glycoside hydrolase family 125 protein [Lactiplantibacillus sp. B652]MDC6396824.1 glycoside hydrolase family 125 protein [Lactiplantibacillus pentosus]PRO95070.1 metal-independent alpha-mannosidase [Lactiplantibacillus pentosus]
MTTNYVDSHVQQFVNKINQLSQPIDPQLGTVFQKTFLNTLETTISDDEQGYAFILTGDIPAMWQRDSTAQVRPYLALAHEQPAIATLITRVVQRQFFNMAIDPYANAFNETANGHGHQTDQTEMGPWIWERKFEIDSLCYPVQLAYLLYKNTGVTAQFDDNFVTGVKRLLTTFETEQHHATSPYRFVRTVDRPEDTLERDGLGTPVADTGMIWSGFRPSDDACEYGYLIPANMFAVVILDYLQVIFSSVLDDPNIVARARRLQTAVRDGIETYGYTTNANGEKVYAYEVDGLGHAKLMDDGNVPSLLSAPYLGYCDLLDPNYQRTRQTLLSPENPYYYSGHLAAGQGSPHTPAHYIWPIAIAMEGLTTNSRDQQLAALQTLIKTTGGTDLMHESFNVDDDTQFTREWFSWANMMYCELLLTTLGFKIER